MSDTGRRLVTLLVVLGVLGAPAVALRALCIGASCDEGAPAAKAVPFCSLPASTRNLIEAGFYEGRSPDALGVTRAPTLLSSDDEVATPWPWAPVQPASTLVPLAFVGPGIQGGGTPSAGLADVAPTLEHLLGIRRPFPEVRSGRALEGVVRPGAFSPLIVTIVWKGIGERDGETAAIVDALSNREDSAIGTADVGSLPLDPAAVLTTIGSGGIPSEHGVTGSRLRGRGGLVVPSWSREAPTSVIATLGDDLDEATGGTALVGLVADRPTDRGLIGGTWYQAEDDDDVVIERRDPVAALEGLLDAGYGADEVPDLVGVTATAGALAPTATTAAALELVLSRVPDATVVVTATGSTGTERGAAIRATEVAHAVDAAIGAPVVERVGSSGLFLDQRVVADRGISTQRVVDVMAAEPGPDGSALFADAFPAFAVAFGRYC